MKLAIMQPYFFPYIGYFQLIAAVDQFVFYDDVNFITRGWVNRNRILLNGQAHYLTVPLMGASQNRLICDTLIQHPPLWRRKMLAMVQQAYGKAPYFEPVFALFDDVLNREGDIGSLARDSVMRCAEYMGLQVDWLASSAAYGNAALKGEARVRDICRREGATAYYNAPGGRALYDEAQFAADGIRLHFIEPKLVPYAQFGQPFVAGLSILDVLMFNSPDAARRLVTG